MSNTSCNLNSGQSTEWTWPISFTSSGYSYVMISNRSGGVFATGRRSKSSNVAAYSGNNGCTRFQVICIGF